MAPRRLPPNVPPVRIILETPDMTDFSSARWRKSSASMGNGNCVEVGYLGSGEIAVRDSKNQTGPVLLLQPSGWQTFLADLKAGELDLDH
jgi:hypothetical protein